MAANDSNLFGVSLNNFAYALYHKQAAAKGMIFVLFGILLVHLTYLLAFKPTITSFHLIAYARPCACAWQAPNPKHTISS